MEANDYIAFIVEGEDREPLIINNIFKVFFFSCKFQDIYAAGRAEYLYALEKAKRR